MTQRRFPEPPRGLSPRARVLWRHAVRGWDLEAHHLEVLRTAVEAMTRGDQARVLLSAEGIVYSDRFGNPRKHPAVGIEEQARLQLLRALRELNLDDETLAEKRPPRGRGRRA